MELRNLALALTTAAMLLVTGGVSATDMPPLAKKYNCTNCHAIDVKMIGPSWMDISRAYNENGKTGIGTPVADLLKSKTAEEWLKYKISHGGAGIWGTVLMPATDPNDIWQDKMDKLVKDILELSKGGASKEGMLQLASYYRCNACHAMDSKLIGPSWMDISRFYNGNGNSNGITPYGVKTSDVLRSKTPEELLSFRISHGGLGNWGVMLMPAMEYRIPTSSDDFKPSESQKHDDLNDLVKFILDLAKK